MVCYQVSSQFAFRNYKPVLVSIHIKKQKAPARLVHAAWPFGRGLKVRRWFSTKKGAVRYAAHLKAVYKNRTMPPLAAIARGQLPLF
jgi:hypothetical protein